MKRINNYAYTWIETLCDEENWFVIQKVMSGRVSNNGKSHRVSWAWVRMLQDVASNERALSTLNAQQSTNDSAARNYVCFTDSTTAKSSP